MMTNPFKKKPFEEHINNILDQDEKEDPSTSKRMMYILGKLKRDGSWIVISSDGELNSFHPETPEFLVAGFSNSSVQNMYSRILDRAVIVFFEHYKEIIDYFWPSGHHNSIVAQTIFGKEVLQGWVIPPESQGHLDTKLAELTTVELPLKL